jgi:hypothetical protein
VPPVPGACQWPDRAVVRLTGFEHGIDDIRHPPGDSFYAFGVAVAAAFTLLKVSLGKRIVQDCGARREPEGALEAVIAIAARDVARARRCCARPARCHYRRQKRRVNGTE